MKILKLLNRKNFSIVLIFFLSFSVYAEDKPVDIWNIDKEKIFQFDTTNKSAEESAKIIKNFMAGNVKLEETFDYSERIMDWY